MTLFYLDTSVIVKRYKAEKGSDSVNLLFTDISSKSKMVTSILSAIELTGVVSRLMNSKSITHDEANDILAYFNEDTDKYIDIEPITDQVLARAVQISSTYGTRAADAIHASTIIELNNHFTKTEIKLVAVIADKRLYDTVKDNGIDVLNPEDGDALSSLKAFL